VDQETVRVLCIVGYVVVGMAALYSALTLAAIAVNIRELLPSTLLKALDQTGPRPRDYLMKPGIRDCIVLLAVFWLCWVGWYYSGEAGDMPHHLLRLTAYLVGSWVVFIGILLAYVGILRVVVWWRWTQAVVAQHEARLAETPLTEASLDKTSQAETSQVAASLERIETLLEKMVLLDGNRHEHHNDTHLPPDVFRVPYQGDKYTGTILSASEMALQHGYRYFVLLPQKEATQQSTGLLIRGMHKPEGCAFDAHRLQQTLAGVARHEERHDREGATGT
jgi:hypothetical protein